MPIARFQELLGYFNDADKSLKEKINGKIIFLQEKLDSLHNIDAPNKASLYVELQTEYTSRLTTFNTEKSNLSLEISTIIKQLEEKKTKTTESLVFTRSLNNTFLGSVLQLDETLIKHNVKTDSFQIQKDNANLQLKNHYLSEIYDEVKNFEKSILELGKELDELNKKTSELSEKITKNKSIISSEHKACEILNKKLETFLGRQEIIFEVSTSGGYVLKRNGKMAKNLSE